MLGLQCSHHTHTGRHKFRNCRLWSTSRKWRLHQLAAAGVADCVRALVAQGVKIGAYGLPPRWKNACFSWCCACSRVWHRSDPWPLHLQPMSTAFRGHYDVLINAATQAGATGGSCSPSHLSSIIVGWPLVCWTDWREHWPIGDWTKIAVMGISTSSVFSRPDMGMRFYFAITTDNVAGGAMTKYFHALTSRGHISAPPWSLRNFTIF